jgi:hypothetical protein
VIVTEPLKLSDTFPAASFAQAYSVLDHSVANVYSACHVEDHPASPESGAVALSVIL